MGPFEKNNPGTCKSKLLFREIKTDCKMWPYKKALAFRYSPKS